MSFFLTSLRLTAATLAVCVVEYTAVILAVARLVPETAEGWLVAGADGRIVGSRQVAQSFTEPGYFWPRPSAVDYDGAGGSNKSPTNPDVAERARELVARYEASPDRPLPAELAAASGSGLDPHITEHAALYQASRVAAARGLTDAEVRQLINRHAFAAGGWMTPQRIVNVLEINLALDGAE